MKAILRNDGSFKGQYDTEREAKLDAPGNTPSLPDGWSIDTRFDDWSEWREHYTAGERECPQCETDHVVSKVEAERVFHWQTSHDYVCAKCHIDQ